jgi:bis(5'-nucleosyl)-tetraphosphatase (symmetrical)
MPTYAIGDIQGCADELERLLEKLKFDPASDRVWFVGDLVNRGPRSLDALRIVRALGDAAVSVLGNHDLHLLAVAFCGTKIKRQDTLSEILSAPDRDELLHWLRQQSLVHYDATLAWTMVHAGFAPQWTLAQAQTCARELEVVLRDDHAFRDLFEHMYGDQPAQWSDDLKDWDRLRFITNCFTRLRFCDSQGKLDLKFKGEIANAPRGLMPWFRVPGRRTRGTRIVCGHWSAIGLHEEDDVLAIDTGCVWGERLCAVRLDQTATPVFVRCSSSGLSVET